MTREEFIALEKRFMQLQHRVYVIKSAISQSRWKWEEEARKIIAPSWVKCVQSLAKQSGRKRKVPDDLKKEFTKSIFNLLVFAYELGGGTTLQSLGLKVKLNEHHYRKSLINEAFYLANEDIIKALNKRAKWVSDRVFGGMAKEADRILIRELKKPDGSLEAAREQVSNYFNLSNQSWKAYQVANTEFQIGISTARYDVYRKSGFKKHRWVTVGDSRVRKEHRTNEMQGWIRIGQPFSNGALHTGDGASAINCRCVNEVDSSEVPMEKLWRGQ